jgi:hypothetical protein
VLIELLGHLKVFKVFVIGSDLDGMVRTFKIVCPLFESSDDGKHLPLQGSVLSTERQQGAKCYLHNDMTHTPATDIS